MIKSIEQLSEEVAIEVEQAEIWLERRNDADKERHIAHVHYIMRSRNVDRLSAELRAAMGEPS